MDTPLQTLIQRLEALQENSDGFSAEVYAYQRAIDEAQRLREKENVVIMQALNDGKGMALGTIENKSLEQYVNETYPTDT